MNNPILRSMQESLGENLPGILGALAFLIVGWIVAVIVRALVRRGLGLIKLNQVIESGTGSKMDVEGGFALGAYFLVLLMALIGFFNALNLELVSGPLQGLMSQILDFAPKLAGAGVLLLVAFILATVLKKVAAKALASTTLDERLSAEAGMKPFSESMANVLYWLVFLLFLPAILGALQMDGLLQPIQGMIDKILGMVPNIVAAVAIGLVGWFVAKLLRDLVTNLLSATGADSLGQQAGLAGTMTLSKLAGLVIYIFVLVPALIAALDALKIEAISGPATDMLGTFMAAVPNVFAAALIIVIAYYVAGFIGNLAASLLSGVGFDAVPEKIGVGAAFQGETTASKMVGRVIVFFAVVFAVVEASNRLGFHQVSELVATFIEFGGSVLTGVVIIGVGLWVSNLAYAAVRGLQTAQAGFFAGLARYAILGLVFAMGLRAMGIANEIVTMAFGFTLGSVAVAIALSFGLGGREAAGKQMEHWFRRMRGE